jgi:small-conductance mechanosensitive channel
MSRGPSRSAVAHARWLAALVGVAALVLLAVGPRAFAADASAAALDPESVQSADDQLREIERTLRVEDTPAPEKLRDFLGRIPGIRDQANRCIEQNEARLDSLQSKLETLGDVSVPAAAGVQQQRDALERQSREVEQQLQICRVLLLRANEMQDRVTAVKQAQLTARLLEREAPAWEILARNLREPGQWWNTARLFLVRSSGLDALSWIEAIGLVGLILFCVGGGLFLRQPMFEFAGRMPGGPTVTAGFAQAVVACAANVLPALVTSVAVSVYLTVIGMGRTEWAFITLLSYGLAGYFVFVFAVRTFLAPCPPAGAYLPAPERTLRGLARRLRTLAIVVLIVSLLSATLVVESFPDPVQDFLRLVIATVLIVDLTRIIWLAGGLLRWHDTRLPRLLLSAGMLFGLGAEWGGYRNMAEYVVGGVTGTMVVFGLAWFVWRLFDDLYDGLDEGRRRWQRRLRESLGVQPDQYMPGVTWLRVLTALGVWGGFGLLVLLMWGLSDTGLAFILRTLNEGLQIGSFEIVPIKLVWGIVALVVLIALTGWLKQRLGQRWLTRTRMERGAREAVVTITGWTGVVLALLVGLAIAGVQFTNIALIAGALSVGIGFGLQNIFNNFVSGLILLFERPVKTDDWIVVGNTEGLVKKISIRSTQIQTFDHADVIVPNSEIIQGQVVNWMLRDPFGRVTVPIRAAYGSDPEHVRDILLQIANDHPRVIKDAVLAPPPEVLLRRFGDSGFEFEVRMFIRDIDYVLHVTSDVNFAIEREFRRHGIVIPYPRQDVRIERMSDPWASDRARRPPRPPSERGASDEMGDGDGGE